MCRGMTATRVIRPYLLRDTMNAERYLQTLEDYVWPIVSGWGNIDELVFMHNGAPPYFAPNVSAWLNHKFPGRLGRGPHEWPAKVQFSRPVTSSCAAGQNLAQWNNWRTGFGTLSPTSHTTSCRRLDSIPGRFRKLVDATGAYIEF